MKDAFATFQDYLGKNKQKLTPQRRIIFQQLLEHSGHISPEKMYFLAKAADPGIGLATVYRTLKLLADSGVARELKFDDGVARYELDWGRDHHDHIVCIKCGQSEDVLDPRIEKLQELLAQRHGFTITTHKMILYGLCEKCH